MSTVHTCMDEPSSNFMYLMRDQGGAGMDFAIVSIKFITLRVSGMPSPHLNIFEIWQENESPTICRIKLF